MMLLSLVTLSLALTLTPTLALTTTTTTTTSSVIFFLQLNNYCFYNFCCHHCCCCCCGAFCIIIPIIVIITMIFVCPDQQLVAMGWDLVLVSQHSGHPARIRFQELGHFSEEVIPDMLDNSTSQLLFFEKASSEPQSGNPAASDSKIRGNSVPGRGSRESLDSTFHLHTYTFFRRGMYA